MASLRAGGAERQMVLLLRHLDRARFAPALCLLIADGEFLPEVPADVPVIDLGKRGPADVARPVSRLAGVLRARRPEVVVAKVDYTNMVTALATRLASPRTPLILGEESVQSVALAGAGSLPRLRRAGLRWAYRRATVVTAPSRGVVTDVVSELDLADASFAVIPNMVDVADIARAAAEPARHAFSESPAPLIVAAGRLTAGKGQDDLLVALARLNRARPTNLLILGSGPDRIRLERLAGDLGVAERVSFPGYVGNPYALMRQAAVFVSPSHSESFGTVIIEAMAAGAPVVSTRVPAGPETIIDHGVTGLFARPRDPADLAARIESVLGEPAAARALAARGRASAGRFDVGVITERYAELLARTAAGAPGDPG
jgi:glycosyltransferase involved in cell wall biosynthesis